MPPLKPETLAEVYREHRRALLAVAVNIVGCQHRAEDAVHDAFARMTNSDAVIDEPVAYSFRAVRNAALNCIRQNVVQQRAIQLYQVTRAVEIREQVDQGNQSVSNVSRSEALVPLIERLNPDQRELILLKVHANLTFAQIGEIQNVPMKTVATRYRRTIEHLKSCWEQVHER